tara:strand:+ start:315 stop:425 length:111 start_codon:yes stop_codon:yes gene_type:complete
MAGMPFLQEQKTADRWQQEVDHCSRFLQEQKTADRR